MSWGRNLPYPDAYPRIGKNDTGGLVVSGGAVFTNGQLVLAPGPSPDAVYAIVRFTAPTTGLYNVGASFVGAEGSPGTTTDVHVLANGIPYFNGTISGYGNGTSFTSPFPFTLNAGDTLDFVCGDGGNGFQGDSTGFAATVTFLRGGSRVLLFPAVELGWATESGESYQVQWATQLQTNDWNDLGAPVAGDGALHYMFDSTRGQPQRFYRVVTTE